MPGKKEIPIPILVIEEEGGIRMYDPTNSKVPGFIAEVLLKRDYSVIISEGQFRSVEVSQQTHEKRKLLFRTPVNKPLAQYLPKNRTSMSPQLFELLQERLTQAEGIKTPPAERTGAQGKWSATGPAAHGASKITRS